MVQLFTRTAGKFCWLDLATRSASKASHFYEAMFGWAGRDQPANGGSFTRLSLRGDDVGSLYQLSAGEIAQGAQSHWTPYVGVDDLLGAVERAVDNGGAVIVPPFAVSDVASIALIEDAVGARLGLWSLKK